jgi:dolichol-phosphate mannosyltransferase
MTPPRSTSKPVISVIVSFYNEERNIPALIERLRRVFRAEIADRIGGYELIFINDNSTDKSTAILLEECRRGKDIVIVNMSRNFGIWECVIAGMQQAQGDAIVNMDADLQDPPELIPTLIEKWMADDEAEVVYTTRLRRDGEHPIKLLLTKWAYRFIARTAAIDLPVDSGDFKLLSRRAVDELLRLKEKKPYLRGLISWIGFKQVQVFYNREARHDGRENTKYPVIGKRVIYNFLDSAMISFSDAPLKVSLFLGLVVSMASLGYISVILLQKFMGWYTPGWPAIMASILFLGGVQLLMLGMVGLYINKIYIETTGRPNFIIKNVIRPEQLADAAPDASRSVGQ